MELLTVATAKDLGINIPSWLCYSEVESKKFALDRKEDEAKRIMKLLGITDLELHKEIT